MRLWHYKLIPVLPEQQLRSQWREVMAIKGKIDISKTPNHLLVNKVLEYPVEHFKNYAMKVYLELVKRGHKPSGTLLDTIMMWDPEVFSKEHRGYMFHDWHTNKYLRQCYHNLEEKYDCGGISESEWKKLDQEYKYLIQTRY